jgi:hypothetical protein
MRRTLHTLASQILWYRMVPYAKGWKINPSHFLKQDLARVWPDK